MDSETMEQKLSDMESQVDSIEIENENLNLEDQEEDIPLTPEENAFNEEITNMESELKKMDEQRIKYVETIKEKIRNNVKNGEDAIGYLPRYIKYTIDFHDYQFEDIDGEHTLMITSYDFLNRSEYYEIKKLAEELCGNYLKIQIGGDNRDRGCIIYYSDK